VKRVGGNDLLLADVRILAATNRNLREEIARKTFREDLYFRIGPSPGRSLPCGTGGRT